jgi:MarR family transcriptional regulator, lower aerobic nicotinate degradation pathway regulator
MPLQYASAADLEELPGHFIRRLQQIAVAVFLQETGSFGVTPVQYAALQAICRAPGIDQRTLAGVIGLDTSTTGGVVDRLEGRGLLRRNPSGHDRRVRLLTPTDEGLALLHEVEPGMLRAQERMLSPLSESDQREFMRMIKTLVQANNELSRAPSEA